MSSRISIRLGVVLIAACLIATAVLCTTSTRAQAGADTMSLVGKPAPDFMLQTLDGQQAKLSELKGSVAVLDFWATWCPPCRKSLPHLEKVHQDKALAGKGVKVWAVNAKEEKAKVQDFLKQNNFTFNVPLDADGKVLRSYLIQGIPTTVIVGRDGTIKNAFIGYGGDESAKEIDDAINTAVNEKK
jgi:peroxiredoxin